MSARPTTSDAVSDCRQGIRNITVDTSPPKSPINAKGFFGNEHGLSRPSSGPERSTGMDVVSASASTAESELVSGLGGWSTSAAVAKNAASANPNHLKPRRPKRVALFGSSLNPVTRGHVAIVEALLAMTRRGCGKDWRSEVEPLAVQMDQNNSDGPTENSHSNNSGSGDGTTTNPDTGNGNGNTTDKEDNLEDDEPLFDEVWVGPVYSHPDVEKYRHLAHKLDLTDEEQRHYETYIKKRQLRDSFDDRLTLCQASHHDGYSRKLEFANALHFFYYFLIFPLIFEYIVAGCVPG